MASDQTHIVLFPFLVQGHIIPFLPLAHHIEQRTNKETTSITLINTPLNVKKLRSSLPPASTINLLEIPFESSDHHGLPPGTENTDVLPYPLIIRLLQASTTLRPAFKSLVVDLAGDRLCIIADMFFGWTVTVAKEIGACHVVFSGSGGFGLACYYSIWLSLPHRNCDEETKGGYFQLEDFHEASRFHKTQLPTSILEADGSDPWSLFQRENLTAWSGSDGILFNTAEELDSIGLCYFRRKLGIPAWPIGPVLLNRNLSNSGSGISSNSCKAWLDTKPEKSVLYVSFGSQNTINPSQMMQLGKALASSKINFIWAVRPPIGFDINSDFQSKKWLPENFEENTSGRGILIEKWAPQVEILSHKATGGFLSHCGWNSVLESLSCGVPMIGWAMAGEQFFNVKFLEENLGVCVEVARGKSCEVRCEEIVEKIEAVMSGGEIRRKAVEVKEMMRKAVDEGDGGRKGSSLIAVDEFLTAAMTSTKATAADV
uniref:Glycosyltransferase n=1 Tax=Linum usitatissimum TaxID=4006 RepID=I2BHD9_LINUS|nr:UDP-glycosyltransferase 1 [Linum usitatissimum]